MRLPTSDTERYRNLPFEQYFFDSIAKITPQQKALLPDKLIKKLSSHKRMLVKERFETKAKILAAIGKRFAFVIWDGEVSDDDAKGIFKRSHKLYEWEEAQESILEKNMFIAGDKSFYEWMMLSEFYFDSAHYTVTRKLKAPTSAVSRGSITKIMDENRLFFRSIYTMLMSFEYANLYLKNYKLSMDELKVLFTMFNLNVPLSANKLRIDGIKHSKMATFLKSLSEKGFIDSERLKSSDSSVASTAVHYIISGKGYLVLGEITQRLFNKTDI